MTSYAELETALAQLHEADAQTQRGAFRGRLKHLQRLGLPLDAKPGKGTRIDYSKDQIWQLAIALQFAEFGIDPKTIAELITRHWDFIRKGFESAEDKRGPRVRSDFLLSITPKLMSANWNAQEVGLGSLLSLFPNKPINRHVFQKNPRLLVINISEVGRQLARSLDGEQKA